MCAEREAPDHCKPDVLVSLTKIEGRFKSCAARTNPFHLFSQDKPAYVENTPV